MQTSFVARGIRLNSGINPALLSKPPILHLNWLKINPPLWECLNTAGRYDGSSIRCCAQPKKRTVIADKLVMAGRKAISFDDIEVLEDKIEEFCFIQDMLAGAKEELKNCQSTERIDCLLKNIKKFLKEIILKKNENLTPGDIERLELLSERLDEIVVQANLYKLMRTNGVKINKDDVERVNNISSFASGLIIQDGSVFRQIFPIRSYDIGADGKASILTLMSHLQETALNHLAMSLSAEEFGTTPKMKENNLFWVVRKYQLLVDHYPSRGDIVQVETWMNPPAKYHGTMIRRGWHICDYNSGQTILQATSELVMMKKGNPGQLGRIPADVRAEIKPYIIDRVVLREEDLKEVPKKEDIISGPAEPPVTCNPKWSDLDVNQHVNNVKYVGLVLESIPHSKLEKHELASMTIKYLKECGMDTLLENRTIFARIADSTGEYDHLLRLQNELMKVVPSETSDKKGPEIAVKCWTNWKPKKAESKGNMGI